ncbi:hypothetical protein GCM10010124_12740 [Pilimelia terevasa]|uniref:Prepilin-type N-terminal cleavage/methylation domain-containing protein n=1 Tax=Pilimelia terevasa TaxID=53372 RepID=A0A8J3FGD3_9ACTN|nr:prepilin-type N-terminal cleavage/methylation domain-containing protein [Pilimelia terevasa]GGK21709.1 hypothetical protein GCM10010124_12740 [Pilimelia terevasa]
MRAGQGRAAVADGGFTLIEVLVALGLIGVVMASVAVFLTGAMSTTHRQAGRQAAAQVAAGAVEAAQAAGGAAMVANRPAPRPHLVNDVPYTVTYGTPAPCWQTTASGACAAASPAAGVRAAQLVSLTVTVTWPSTECGTGGTCTETATALLGATPSDPEFPS